ncbi:MAG: flagellin [Myxococcota bacterium]
MSFRIGSMGLSLGAIRSLRSAETSIARSSARLASGLRIHSAADDAAGLAISERFRADIASLQRAQMNTADAIGIAQSAQGGLSEISSLLSEARALAVQSSSGTLDGQTRDQLDDQFQAILSDIDSIAANTSFSTFNPLDNSGQQIDVAVGTTAGDTITITGVDATASSIGAGGIDIATATGAAGAISAIDGAISNTSALAAQFGIAENRLASRSNLLGVQIEATAAAESRIRDADYASETALLTRNQIIQESAIAVLGQANANMSLVLRLLGT